MKILRSDDGRDIEDFVKSELKRKKCSQGRLSSAFAVTLFKSFNLDSNAWDDLPTPTEGPVDEELYELVAVCHDENKFVMDVKPLCGLLGVVRGVGRG